MSFNVRWNHWEFQYTLFKHPETENVDDYDFDALYEKMRFSTKEALAFKAGFDTAKCIDEDITDALAGIFDHSRPILTERRPK